jgi:hypothetical protein
MNKFVTSALALAAAGSLSYADPGDNEWLELDGEINSLASSLAPSNQDGMGWAFLLRATYTFSSDEIATGASSAPDVSGFKFEDVDLAFWGSVAEYGYRVSMDLEDLSGSGAGPSIAVLEDAYAFWDCGGYVTATFGQFKPHALMSNTRDPENQIMIDRTAIGSIFDFWDTGIQADGSYEAFSYWASIQNGGNGQESDHFYTLRVEWDYNAGAGMAEGAMGGNDELNLTVGGAYVQDDTTLGDANAYGIDVAGNFSSFGFAAEVLHLDDEAFAETSSDFGRGAGFPLQFAGDSNPWNIMGSYLINPEWEVAVRYENLDNDDFAGANGPDNTILSVALVWYRSGKNAKWTAQWSDYDADTGNGFPDGSIFQVGLTLGATR